MNKFTTTNIRQAGERTTVPFSIHPATSIGQVQLVVADLEQEVVFYQNVVGLQLRWREANSAGLGSGQDDLLMLHEVPGAHRYQGVTGMYHFAILLPERRELARCIVRLFQLDYPNYPTDHVMTQTTYLQDPEGNQIELYVDTPEEGNFTFEGGELVARRADGRLSNGREPLNLPLLFAELDSRDLEKLDQPIPSETVIGHVHLYVADLDESLAFYHHVLGFDHMGTGRNFRMGMVSAGGYHHHIGFNTWMGEGAPPPPDGSLGLRYFSVVLPDQVELQKVLDRVRAAQIQIDQMEGGWFLKDPSGNGILLSQPGNSP